MILFWEESTVQCRDAAAALVCVCVCVCVYVFVCECVCVCVCVGCMHDLQVCVHKYVELLMIIPW